MRPARSRAERFAGELEAASEALVAAVEAIESEAWGRSPGPGRWSPGKEADHVADAAILHQWFVRRSVGERPGGRPSIERAAMTTGRSRDEVVDRLRAQAAFGAALIRGLSDDQLALPVYPPRARDERVGEYIERVLIGHVRTHRAAIAGD